MSIKPATTRAFVHHLGWRAARRLRRNAGVARRVRRAWAEADPQRRPRRALRSGTNHTAGAA